MGAEQRAEALAIQQVFLYVGVLGMLEVSFWGLGSVGHWVMHLCCSGWIIVSLDNQDMGGFCNGHMGSL